MVLTVGKWNHQGANRHSEWLLTDSETKACYFIRRTKTGRLACGAQGTFESRDNWLRLEDFACASDITLQEETSHSTSSVAMGLRISGWSMVLPPGESFSSVG